MGYEAKFEAVGVEAQFIQSFTDYEVDLDGSIWFTGVELSDEFRCDVLTDCAGFLAANQVYTLELAFSEGIMILRDYDDGVLYEKKMSLVLG